MKRLINRSRSLVLVVALAVVAAMCTVSTANAASSASAAPHEPAASSSQCKFMESLKTCKSTDRTVSYTDNAYGNTSDCTFVFTIAWGDSSPTTTVKVTDPTDGPHLLATHRYAATPRAYTITVTVQVTAGSCTGTNSVHTFTLVKAPSPVSCPSPGSSEPSVITTANYAGYSVHRAGSGCMTEVTGTWTMPSISCPTNGQPGYSSDPRVAIWAGLWGEGNPHVKGWSDTAWLPQIGVTGQCDNGHLVYYADWEMETNVKNGGALTCGDCGGLTPGAGPQCLVNPADTLTYLRTWGLCATFGTNYPSFEVRAGDKVTATVTYNGPVTSGPDTGDLDFDLSLTNDTLAPGTNAVASFPDVITTMPVNLKNIIGQGGLIVENNTNGALAKFSPAIPIQFNSWKATGSGPYDTSQWQMWISGKQLTTVSPSLSTQYTFNVSYKSGG